MSQPQDETPTSQQGIRELKRLVMRVASNCLVLAGTAVLIGAFPKYQHGDVFDALMMGEVAIFFMLLALWLRPW